MPRASQNVMIRVDDALGKAKGFHTPIVLAAQPVDVQTVFVHIHSFECGSFQLFQPHPVEFAFKNAVLDALAVALQQFVESIAAAVICNVIANQI